jgi:hypothetical protein
MWRQSNQSNKSRVTPTQFFKNLTARSKKVLLSGWYKEIEGRETSIRVVVEAYLGAEGVCKLGYLENKNYWTPRKRGWKYLLILVCACISLSCCMHWWEYKLLADCTRWQDPFFSSWKTGLNSSFRTAIFSNAFTLWVSFIKMGWWQSREYLAHLL